MSENQHIIEIKGYITIAEAARRLGVSDTRVYGLINEGRLDIALIAGGMLVVEESVEKYKPKTAGGRPRTKPLVWRESPKDGAFIIKVITVKRYEDKSKELDEHLRKIWKENEHLFPRTTRRYISEGNDVEGRVKIQLIWKQNDLPDNEEYERELAAFRKEFADVLDWSTAQYKTETVLLHT